RAAPGRIVWSLLDVDDGRRTRTLASPAQLPRPRRKTMTARLAAPRTDAAQLPASTLAALRDALEQELAAQQAHLRDLEATIDELTGQPGSDSMIEREMAERARHRTAAAIGEIEHALRRLEDGTYGTCEGRRAAIARERRDASPAPRPCRRCPPPA